MSPARAPRWTARATQALLDASAQVRVIAASTPWNLREELSRLEAAWGSRCGAEAPRFAYAPPPDLAALRGALLAIAADLDGLGALGLLYAERAREIEAEAAICELAGGPGLWAAARRRYARRDQKLKIPAKPTRSKQTNESSSMPITDAKCCLLMV